MSFFASAITHRECHPYYLPYVHSLGDVDLTTVLQTGKKSMTDLFFGLDQNQLKHTYATGKWNIAEVLVHLMDTERIFQYRALRFARNDDTALMGFEQDGYVVESGADQRSLAALEAEYHTVRDATLSLFNSFSPEQLVRAGTASDAKMSVRALGFVIAGHQRHHLEILGEHYL